MAMTFRKAAPSERDGVERVLRAAFTPYVRALGRELSAAGYARLPAELERGDIYVALEADQIVGVIRTERRDDGIFIDQIGVDPARQGAGVGRSDARGEFLFEGGYFGTLGDPTGKDNAADRIGLTFIKAGFRNRDHKERSRIFGNVKRRIFPDQGGLFSPAGTQIRIRPCWRAGSPWFPSTTIPPSAGGLLPW